MTATITNTATITMMMIVLFLEPPLDGSGSGAEVVPGASGVLVVCGSGGGGATVVCGSG